MTADGKLITGAGKAYDSGRGLITGAGKAYDSGRGGFLCAFLFSGAGKAYDSGGLITGAGKAV